MIDYFRFNVIFNTLYSLIKVYSVVKGIKGSYVFVVDEDSAVKTIGHLQTTTNIPT